MQISLMVDGKILDQETALQIAHNELGVLNGTSLLADSLADGVHQGTDSDERTLLNTKGLSEYIKTITAQSMLGVYLRSCLLLKQIEDSERKQKLGECLVECYPTKGYTPHEDGLEGTTPAMTLEARLMASLAEREGFEEAAENMALMLQEWVENDHAEGRYESAMGASGYKLTL